uniref:Major sperm protein n=1 Tax=Panagrolaimus sp. JU765 TaxID=591449 RepID=A0AC34RKM4_9BILA
MLTGSPTGAKAFSPSSLADREAHVGRTPDFEVLVTPKWLVFSGDEGYRRPQIGKVTLTNRDNETIIYRLRARDRLLIYFSTGYGILKPGQSKELTVIVTSSDQWHRDPNEYAGRRIRVVVENLFLPPEIDLPENPTKLVTICRKIFHSTATLAPMTRLYTKFSLLLPKIPDDWTIVEANLNKAVVGQHSST